MHRVDRTAGCSQSKCPLGWDPAAAGSRAGDGMARFTCVGMPRRPVEYQQLGLVMAGQECYNYTVFLHDFANFPQKGGAAVEKTTVSGVECGLHDGPALGVRPSDVGKCAGGGAAACPAPSGRLRCTAKCPERMAGGERPAEIPDAGGAALAVPFAGSGW